VAVLAPEHEAEAEYHFAAAIGRDAAHPLVHADHYIGHIANLDRRPDAPRDNVDIFDLFYRHRASKAVNEGGFAGLRQDAATDVEVVVVDGLDYLVEGEVQNVKTIRVDANEVLLLIAAPAVDLSGPRGCAQSRLENPILERAQLGRPGSLANNEVVKNFAEAGGHRAERRPMGAFGHLDGAQPFGRELAR
jgi:hypothetical protein